MKRQKITEYHTNFATNLARSTSRKKEKKNGTEATTTFESLVKLALKVNINIKTTAAFAEHFREKESFSYPTIKSQHP